jgi:NADPH2:quinone reductase
MRAAWYEKQGAARDVLVVGEMPDPEPGPGEARIRVVASGVNPGDVKKRQDAFGVGMPFGRVIPHSDGAGIIDRVGEGVMPSRIGERVWCFGAQSYRPFGTAAEFVVVPSAQALRLPESVSFARGACLGIPGITAHRAVHAAGQITGRVVLVQGGAGAVGCCAVGLANLAGARVIATVRSEPDALQAVRAGAHEVVRTDGRSAEQVVEQLQALAPGGVDHVVEVAFDANIGIDERVLAIGGSVAAYASSETAPGIPFWPLVFKNIRMAFLGSDDFPLAAKTEAACAVNALLDTGWAGFDLHQAFPLAEIAGAHECVEKGRSRGRVVVMVTDEQKMAGRPGLDRGYGRASA